MPISSRSPAQFYSQTGIETSVGAADSHQLILLLLDGAIIAILTAHKHMDDRDVAAKGQSISKAIDIIESGLKQSLAESTTENSLRQKLLSLYEYMVERLMLANINNDAQMLVEVSGLLREIRSAWAEIGDHPEVQMQRRLAA